MIYVILFIILLLLFLRYCNSYSNPYKLIMVFGKKGSGKTTYLTKEALKAIKRGTKVYSTVKIPGTNFFDVYDIGRFTFEA